MINFLADLLCIALTRQEKFQVESQVTFNTFHNVHHSSILQISNTMEMGHCQSVKTGIESDIPFREKEVTNGLQQMDVPMGNHDIDSDNEN